MAALRGAILKHVRVRVAAGSAAPAVSVPFSQLFRRCLSEEVKGTFLDKSEVTERIIKVVKNFHKVDPSKVSTFAHFSLKNLSNLGIVRYLIVPQVLT